MSVPVPYSSQAHGQQPLRTDEADASPRQTALDGTPSAPRSRALAVLLLSSDRNFRLVISLLLTRRGCSVILGRLVEPASREPADVVVIDGGTSQTTITRALQIAQALAPSVGVVLVAGTPCEDPHGLPLVARWGPFQELFAAIEQAAGQRRGID